ncbi:type 1 glutamine amidotransferase [Ruegeria sp. HKCCD6228]|uniref:Type 1 glutamine amidotransferase n=1 Tax=Ruegeria atlantica TaxID=81569 RepID=A0AA90YX45_9RHOB|nr:MULTISPECIES: type 1 glutamine amidotransferase [Ruegeria]NOD95676.1 type 1 glutamine amidotransferase [Ruegeria sp. HKCCD6228]NOE16594.1 type 1 glutamine amidotransferase [Ruegeria atlantica]
MKIGILQTGHTPEVLQEEFGDYDELFPALLRDNGFEFVTFAVVDGTFPDGADDADGWIITGSRHGVYEDLPWIAPLEALVRDIWESGKPLIGVCFGHQIIAQALGGKVEKFAGGWAVGRTEYEYDGNKLWLNAWHQDQVVELPKEARVLGRNAFCENAMLAYGDTIWTVQAHPEFTNGFVAGLMRTRGKGVVPEDLMREAANRETAPDDNARIARHMAEFLKKERA